MPIIIYPMLHRTVNYYYYYETCEHSYIFKYCGLTFTVVLLLAYRIDNHLMVTKGNGNSMILTFDKLSWLGECILMDYSFQSIIDNNTKYYYYIIEWPYRKQSNLIIDIGSIQRLVRRNNKASWCTHYFIDWIEKDTLGRENDGESGRSLWGHTRCEIRPFL